MNYQYDPNYTELGENLYQDQEDSEFYPDSEYDDGVWSQLQYKIQRLKNLDEYSSEEEKYYAARRIPISTNPNPHCIERLHGPYYTTDSVNEDEVYPPKYYNVTCEAAGPGHETNKKQTNVMCKAHKSHLGCQVSIQPLNVFKTSKKNGKKCWKLEKTLRIMTGCKCSKF